MFPGRVLERVEECMMKFGVLASAAALLLSAGAALAGGDYHPPTPQAPEIDVLSGFGAVAALGAVGALLWERRRRF
jgi:hypothetical protein